MTFVEKHRFAGSRSEKFLLKVSVEGEYFGVGMFEAMAELYPELADECTACATMEWFNIHYCEPFAHEAGIHISLERAEELGRQGAKFAQDHDFERVAKATILETPAADALYAQLARGAPTPELKTLGDDLYVHEASLRDWLQSELDGKSDGAEKVFAYLERHGITREEAVTPRKNREDLGGDTQHLVLALFDNESAADQAVHALKSWDKATEYMRLDAIGVLVKDRNGEVKEHKLGRQAGKRGMGIGVALGVIAAIPTGGLSLVGSAVGGAVGGGVIGKFFHKGLKLTDADVARIDSKLDAGHAAVGVLTWDSETDAVTDKLKELGGTPQTHEVARLTDEQDDVESIPGRKIDTQPSMHP
ncbi:DUF1269 domain-containing protein [Pyxidicoccus sp. 3LFB2]